MSTDSTELTFVRCPSCRSLVPAVSTRCRMCGASLESGEGEEAQESGEASGRVRQRTMSKPKSDLNAAVKQLREEFGDHDDDTGEPEAAEAASSAEQPAERFDFEDPLGAYIEEVEEPAGSGDGSDDDADDDPVEEVAAAEPEPVAAAPEAEEAPAPAAAPPEEEAPQRPRLVIESGSGRGGHKRGLSFGSKSEAPPEEERPKRQAPPQERPAPRASRPAEDPPVQERPAPRASRPVEETPVREQPPERPRPQARAEQPRAEARAAKEPANDRESSKPSAGKGSGRRPQAVASQHGRLFGWLVSYAQADGSATELREGKFFVTGSSLKDTDLVIEDESVSTPHAMAKVGVEEGLVIQDLMSERGVFIRKRGQDTYQKVEDTVSVEHGDWIRFGDVEYLVSLIAHVGVK